MVKALLSVINAFDGSASTPNVFSDNLLVFG